MIAWISHSCSLADPWRQISQVRSAVSHRLRSAQPISSAQPIKHTLRIGFNVPIRKICRLCTHII